MHIRSPRKSDRGEVVLLEKSFQSGWSEAAVFGEFTRETGVLLIARDENHAVQGWCSGLLINREAELLRIAVAQTKRSSGVASALLDRFESECLQRNVASFFLEVASRNIAARRLYEKFHYKEVGRRKAYYSQPPDDALIMNKLLARLEIG